MLNNNYVNLLVLRLMQKQVVCALTVTLFTNNITISKRPPNRQWAFSIKDFITKIFI